MIFFFPSDRVHRVPTESCVWAVLTPSDRAGRTRSALQYEFERWLPQPIESYACAFKTLGDGRVAACGCERSLVESLLGEAESIRPESLPDFLRTHDIDADDLELAIHDLTPRCVTTGKSSVIAMSLLVAALLSASATVGLVRRAAALDEDTTHLTVLVDDAYSMVLPADAPANQPRSILVRGLLREARDAREEDAPDRFDAASAMADLLAAWDQTSATHVNRLTVRKGTMTLDASVDGDPQALLSMLESLPGWSIGSPSVRRSGSEQRVTVTLEQEKLSHDTRRSP